MGKRSSSSKRSSSHQGYGMHNVSKVCYTKKVVKEITRKKWADVTSMDMYILFQKGWTTEKIQDVFSVSSVTILNRLRF